MLAFQLPPPAGAQSTAVEGFIAGKVYERNGTTPLDNAVVIAQHITTNQSFSSPPVDKKGNFVIRSAPPGIYGFVINHDGQEYRIAERVDARIKLLTPEGQEIPAKMTFLLEVCFRMDKDSPEERTAVVIRDQCQSELPPFLAGLLQDQAGRGLLILLAGAAAVATTLGILAATGGTEASPVTAQP
jgi:hypothetical protein